MAAEREREYNVAKLIDRVFAENPFRESKEHRIWTNDIARDSIRVLDLDMQYAMDSVKRSLKMQSDGVYAIASSFMSLKGLVERLATPEVDIPVSAVGVGPVSPGDIRKASKPLESKPKFATVLALQVEVTPKAFQLAETLGVRVICADSIEHLCQMFKKYMAESDEQVLPCVLCILPKFVLNKEDPIVMGVLIAEGSVRLGTPICVPQRAFIYLGRVAWIEKDHQPIRLARQGDKVTIKISAADPKTQQVMLGREFYVEDELVSCIPRRSI